MPVEPSKLIGRVFACRFRVVAMDLLSTRQPAALLDLQDGRGAARGTYELSLQELQVLIGSGLFVEDAGEQS